MRLLAAFIPAGLITLVLFILMQAMVASPERIPGHGAPRNPVAFVSPFAPARGMSDEESAAQSLPDPAASPPWRDNTEYPVSDSAFAIPVKPISKQPMKRPSSFTVTHLTGSPCPGISAEWPGSIL